MCLFLILSCWPPMGSFVLRLSFLLLWGNFIFVIASNISVFFFHFLIVCLLLCSIFLSFSFIVPISSSFLLSMGFLSLVHKSDFFLSYPFCSLSPILHTLFQLLYFCYLILFLSSSYILASYGLYCSLSLLVGFIRLIIYY